MRPALLLLLLSGCATYRPIDCIEACMPLRVREFAPGVGTMAHIGNACRCSDPDAPPPPPSLGRPPARDTFATRTP